MSSIRTLSNGGTNTKAKMKRQEKAEKIGFILNELYPTTPIPLDHDSAYTLTVAVMLSAQTTDKKVNQVTPVLFQKANTLNAFYFQTLKIAIPSFFEWLKVYLKFSH